jgi:hypothetical protein
MPNRYYPPVMVPILKPFFIRCWIAGLCLVLVVGLGGVAAMTQYASIGCSGANFKMDKMFLSQPHRRSDSTAPT